MAAQLMAMNGPARPLARWMAWACTSLPTPVSPVSSRSTRAGASRRSCPSTSASLAEAVGTGVNGDSASSCMAVSSASVTQRNTNTWPPIIRMAPLRRRRWAPAGTRTPSTQVPLVLPRSRTQ